MKIKNIEIFHVDAGWRPWSFIKISTDNGFIGWSECSESNGSVLGIEGVVNDLKSILIGKDPRKISLFLSEVYLKTRQSSGSVIQKAIAGIENALWDIKAKDLNVPVYELFGGAIRNSIPLYWSHCGTSRARASKLVNKPKISNAEDVKTFCAEILLSGFKTIKTNMVLLGDEPIVYMPGFNRSFGAPELNVSNSLLEKVEEWISLLRESLGNSIDIALDLNYNFKPEGYVKIAKRLEKYNLAWLEIDSFNPESLAQIKRSISTPVTSCENQLGLREFLPFFQNRSMDNVAIDIIWNGFTESKKIADLANVYEMNIAPHNYNGYLSTFISLQFCSIVPNLKIAEVDLDDVPWREELFSHHPEIQDGNFILSNRPGWGVELVEDALKKYKWPK